MEILSRILEVLVGLAIGFVGIAVGVVLARLHKRRRMRAQLKRDSTLSLWLELYGRWLHYVRTIDNEGEMIEYVNGVQIHKCDSHAPAEKIPVREYDAADSTHLPTSADNWVFDERGQKVSPKLNASSDCTESQVTGETMQQSSPGEES